MKKAYLLLVLLAVAGMTSCGEAKSDSDATSEATVEATGDCTSDADSLEVAPTEEAAAE
jgi:hypothetical protein